MKTYISSRAGYALLITLIFFHVRCKKLDINTDPNNPPINEATPEVLFPSGVLSSAAFIGGEYAVLGGIWAEYWTQSNLSNQYKTIDSYNLQRTDDVVNRSYSGLFSGALTDYQLAIQKAKERQDWRYNLMATAMKAYTYEVLVDLYDQVPYTEAFQGASNLQPKFDDGYTIYASLLGEIDSALAQDYKSVPFSSDQQNTDLLFHGDMDRWEEFANTLKLKMYLRMVNARPAEAEAGIRALYSAEAPFLTTNAGVNSFVDVPNNSNPFYELNIRRQNTTTNLRASITFISFLQENNDPRIVPYFGTSTPIGMHQGDFTATSAEQPTYGSATPPVQLPTDPVWFITEAESYFMQAEALERYFGGAGAQALYNSGVGAAFRQVGLTAATAAPLLAGVYAYPATGTFAQKLEAIITQKWASFPGSHALEGFFERNRTGFPRTSPVYSTAPSYVAGQFVFAKNAVTAPGNFPKRLVFPDFERSRNVNTPSEQAITAKVWWAL
jgi:hypothetical protein